jgi:hypothetical protein
MSHFFKHLPLKNAPRRVLLLKSTKVGSLRKFEDWDKVNDVKVQRRSKMLM